MLKKIAITGPESTGKSTLTRQLAEHYHTVWVKEYAREYLDELHRPYIFEDILKIAKEQKKREIDLASKASQLLFIDTELIVTKIWSEVKFNKCAPWIINSIEKQDYMIYLLMDIDLPWEYDSQREHPEMREYLFNLYKNELKDRKLNFEIISGNNQQRLQNAIEIVNSYL